MDNKTNINRFDMNTKSGRKLKNTIGGAVLHRIGLVFKSILALFFLLLGLFLMINSFISVDDHELTFLLYYLIDELMALGLTYLVYYFFLKARFRRTLIRWIVTFIVYLIIVYTINFLGEYFVFGIQILTGIFGLITGGVLLLNALRQIRDGVHFMRSLIWGILYLIGGYHLLFINDSSLDFTFVIGFYIFTFAFNVYWESTKAFFSFSSKKREKKRKTITLPTFISAFLPIGFFSNLNSTVSSDDYDKTLFLNDSDEEEKTDLTIYIHTRAGLVPGFGHVDISFDNQVYCYGNYDEDTWLFGGFLSDGVLATTTPENHIKNALTNDKKVLVAYDLKITEKTKEKIKAQIEKMMKKAYRWYPKAEQAALGEVEGNPEDFTDVASKMYLEENTKLYKFEKGSPYKTYYLLGQNCAMVANEIVGHSGIKLLTLNRIVTPGSYLEYLDKLYKMRNTIVVNRSIYMLNDNGKPYLIPEQNEDEVVQNIK